MSQVLIVDDDFNVREAVSEYLNNYGYDVVVAEHGLEALELIERRQCSPSLILTDLDMPVMDGITMIRRLQGHPTVGHVPVILITALPVEELLAPILVLAKPVSPQRLLAAIEHYTEVTLAVRKPDSGLRARTAE